jgi:hypothetical protein
VATARRAKAGTRPLGDPSAWSDSAATAIRGRAERLRDLGCSERTALRIALDEWLFNLRSDEFAQGIEGGYLEGPHWERLRHVSRLLANGQCEAPKCENEANLDCHHVRYDSTGRESLFDVASLCRGCHEQLTEGDALDVYLRNRRAEERGERARALTADREQRRASTAPVL